MVRLLLVLAPAVAIMAGIGGSVTIRFLTKSLRLIVLPDRSKLDKDGKVNI
jgi:asparagine N-glycosylation enzyme membrane subunit Stt3